MLARQRHDPICQPLLIVRDLQDMPLGQTGLAQD
jgi:hypothetical protein